MSRVERKRMEKKGGKGKRKERKPRVEEQCDEERVE